MKKKINIAITQYKVPNDSDKQLKKIDTILNKVKKGTDLVLLPEECYPDKPEVRADFDPFNKFSKLAKKYKLYIAGASDRVDSKGIKRITGFLINRQGQVMLKQNKMCLTPLGIEEGYRGDNIYNLVDTEFGRIALLVCKDSFHRFANDTFQAFRKAKVDLVLNPTWSLKVNQRSVSLVREGIIALCNWSDIYIALSGTVKNQAVKKDGTVLKSFGHAMVVCPIRGVLVEGSETNEEILYTTLEPKYLKEIRDYDKIWQPDNKMPFKLKETK